MVISTIILRNNKFKTGLSIKIDIIDILNDILIVNSANMIESNVKPGTYYYNFVEYDEEKEYLIIYDTGESTNVSGSSFIEKINKKEVILKEEGGEL